MGSQHVLPCPRHSGLQTAGRWDKEPVLCGVWRLASAQVVSCCTFAAAGNVRTHAHAHTRTRTITPAHLPALPLHTRYCLSHVHALAFYHPHTFLVWIQHASAYMHHHIDFFTFSYLRINILVMFTRWRDEELKNVQVSFATEPDRERTLLPKRLIYF